MDFPHKKPKWVLPNKFSANSGVVYTFSDTPFIGAGGNADVYGCEDSHGNIYAVKILRENWQEAKGRFSDEIKFMKQVKHEFLVSHFDDGMIVGRSRDSRFPLRKFPFIVMDRAEKNLFAYLSEREWRVDYDIYAPQFRGLSAALQELHKEGIHRDIKPENILIKDERWLLGDFGLCTWLDDTKRNHLTPADAKVGPKYCPSPESINQSYSGKSTNIDESSDVYQLCAVFWLVLTGWYPLGQIKCNDYNCDGKNRLLFEKLLLALSYNKNKRPRNGSELLEIMHQVTIGQGLQS